MGLRFGENTMYYLVVTFSITYLKVHVHANTKAILWWLLVAHAVHFVVIPLAGRLSDRFGRRPIYFVGAVGALHLGILRLPDDGQRPQRDHHVGDRHRSGVPRLHVCGPAGGHGGDVPDPDALFGGVAGLSGHRRSWPVRWHRSSPFACSRPTNPRCPSPGTWRPAAAVSAVAVLAARETKGIDLAAIDLADAQRLTVAVRTRPPAPLPNDAWRLSP